MLNYSNLYLFWVRGFVHLLLAISLCSIAQSAETLVSAASSEAQPQSISKFAYAQEIPTTSCTDPKYDEPLRPQFHFTACKNWLNDPNGMVFDGEKYHLFFQHNPMAPVWGNMTWGHATSPDMIHWSQHDHALRPYRINDRSGTIYSGTVVVDHNNSLGVQQGNQKTLCAFFTFASPPKFYQALAYSTDGGETWKYWNEGRPVVETKGFISRNAIPKSFGMNHRKNGSWCYGYRRNRAGFVFSRRRI
jgi:sucrose-6-phosphate hydrolase SacC (GH32 family)